MKIFFNLWSEIINIFINEIFYAMENLYHYADDDVLSCSGDSLRQIAASFEISTLKWFGNNLLKANPSKFQAIIIFDLKAEADDICFYLNGHKVEGTKCLKQLGVYIDENLTFDEHIAHLCMKAAR